MGDEAPRTDGPGQWDGRTRTGLGILIFYWTFRWLGPRFAYALLYPVVFYYQFAARKGGRASLDYLRRRFPDADGLRLRWLRYRHFLSFGRILVDRVYGYLGMPGKVEFEGDGAEAVRETVAEGKGLILVSGHVGNWELAAWRLGGLGAPVNAVMFKGESERVERQLKRASGEPPFRIIASNDSLQASLECVAALRRGEVVAMHGDRRLGEAGVDVPFLGAEAKFPYGAFVLAATTGAPVVFVFANRLGVRRYRLLARGPYRFAFTDRARRQEELRRWVGRYVATVEEVLKRHPLQWHNFYMFWE